MRSPEKCESKDEIRQAIDIIDQEIIKLLGKRYGYVKEIVRFKKPTKKSIVAQKRFDSVILTRREMAEKEGLNPDVIERMYRELLGHFIDEELKIIENK